MNVGVLPSGEVELIRALVVGSGSGDKAEGGGKAIHAGPRGRVDWDSDLSGRRVSTAKGEYDLPDEFNQRGNRFVQNALRSMQKDYGDRIEATFRKLPDSIFCRRVKVQKE